MTLRSIARRYAGALFDVARKKGSLDHAARDLESMRTLIAEHGDLRKLFETPTVPAAKKRAVVAALLSSAGTADSDVGRLMLLLAERDRLVLVPNLAAAFTERLMAERRIVPAEVVTAVALDAHHRATLVQALGKAANGEVRVTERVDPAIIGGVVARVGSFVFDGSVVRQLDRMRERLLTET